MAARRVRSAFGCAGLERRDRRVAGLHRSGERVTLLDGYEPIVGDSFVIATGDPVGGAFGCFDLPELQLGARFILQYNPNDITALVSNLPPNDADLNRDGTVGFADLTILLNNWGPCIKATSCCIGDISGDGIRGFTDLTIVLANWGE